MYEELEKLIKTTERITSNQIEETFQKYRDGKIDSAIFKQIIYSLELQQEELQEQICEKQALLLSPGLKTLPEINYETFEDIKSKIVQETFKGDFEIKMSIISRLFDSHFSIGLQNIKEIANAIPSNFPQICDDFNSFNEMLNKSREKICSLFIELSGNTLNFDYFPDMDSQFVKDCIASPNSLSSNFHLILSQIFFSRFFPNLEIFDFCNENSINKFSNHSLDVKAIIKTHQDIFQFVKKDLFENYLKQMSDYFKNKRTLFGTINKKEEGSYQLFNLIYQIIIFLYSKDIFSSEMRLNTAMIDVFKKLNYLEFNEHTNRFCKEFAPIINDVRKEHKDLEDKIKYLKKIIDNLVEDQGIDQNIFCMVKSSIESLSKLKDLISNQN